MQAFRIGNEPLSKAAEFQIASSGSERALLNEVMGGTARRNHILGTVGVAFALSLALGWTSAKDVWLTGIFNNTDDAVRMVQVRDWLAGQAWYDLHVARLGMPGAPEIHWSRIVDVPVAALLKLFGLFLDAELAERAARIAFPLLLVGVALFVTALIMVELLGPSMLLAGMVLVGLVGFTAMQFRPGAVDHHGPQIVLLLLALLFLLRATRASPRWNGFSCAATLAVSVAISIENLPSLVVIGACFVVLWLVAGKDRKAALEGFGAGLLCVTPLVYAATVSPSRWLQTFCDANSFMHLALLTAAGGLCVALAGVTRFLASIQSRAIACLMLGAPLLMGALFFFPQCLGDPYVGIDPVVRTEWLNHVSEAQSFSSGWSTGLRYTLVATFASGVIGLAGLAMATRRSQREDRLRWCLVLAVGASAVLVATFRVAYIQGMHAVTCFGVIYFISIVQSKWHDLRIPAAFVLSNVAIGMLTPADESAAAKREAIDLECGRPETAIGLNRLGPALVLAPMDEGAFLLAFTRHQIVAAPYHRNNAGNRIGVDAFRLPAGDAAALVQKTGVDYLAVCGKESRTTPLIAALNAGAGLDGITKVDVPGAYEIWRIAK